MLDTFNRIMVGFSVATGRFHSNRLELAMNNNNGYFAANLSFSDNILPCVDSYNVNMGVDKDINVTLVTDNFKFEVTFHPGLEIRYSDVVIHFRQTAVWQTMEHVHPADNETVAYFASLFTNGIYSHKVV